MVQTKARNPALEKLRALGSGLDAPQQNTPPTSEVADQPPPAAVVPVVSLHCPPTAAPPPPVQVPEPLQTSTEVLRQDAPTGQPGRPPADTTQISLRLPRRWEAILRRRAAEASLQSGRTVTPQQVILQLIGATIPKGEGGTADG